MSLSSMKLRGVWQPSRQLIAKLDPTLIGLVFVLSLIGLANQYSTSSGDWIHVGRHALNTILAFVVIIAIGHTPFRVIIRFAPALYVICLLGLIFVLWFGSSIKGSQRWLELGVINFQPSELAKVATVLMMGWFLQYRLFGPPFLRTIILCVLIFIPAVLIVRQPDLGTTILLVTIGLATLFIAGIEKRSMLLGAVVVCISLPIIWNNLHDYQKNRILSFSDSQADLMGSGYHAFQSKISIGSGGIYGKGWLNGTQGRLDFLPEDSTDFGFSALAEEFGFFGTLIVLLLYLWLFLRILAVSSALNDNTAKILSCACAISLFAHSSVNIGMVAGLLPVVGAPLPFISYGGSVAITTALQIGIVLSAYQFCREKSFAE